MQQPMNVHETPTEGDDGIVPAQWVITQKPQRLLLEGFIISQ